MLKFEVRPEVGIMQVRENYNLKDCSTRWNRGWEGWFPWLKCDREEISGEEKTGEQFSRMEGDEIRGLAGRKENGSGVRSAG